MYFEMIRVLLKFSPIKKKIFVKIYFKKRILKMLMSQNIITCFYGLISHIILVCKIQPLIHSNIKCLLQKFCRINLLKKGTALETFRSKIIIKCHKIKKNIYIIYAFLNSLLIYLLLQEMLDF